MSLHGRVDVELRSASHGSRVKLRFYQPVVRQCRVLLRPCHIARGRKGYEHTYNIYICACEALVHLSLVAGVSSIIL